MGLGGVAIATLPSVIFPKLMFSDRLGGVNLAPSTHTTIGFAEERSMQSVMGQKHLIVVY